MTDDLPPVSIGASGLQGRPQLPPRPTLLEEPEGYDENGNPIWAAPRAVGKAVPANCLRVLSSPAGQREGCGMDCPGRQRDGSCLAELVRDAQAQGVEDWGFEINSDGVALWWDPLWTPAVREPDPTPEPPSFLCPHCGVVNVQDPANFHYWCSGCGLNGNDPA